MSLPSGPAPQQSDALSEAALDALLAEATAAIVAAPDLDALAEVRTSHVTGRGAPVVLARRSLGQLPRPADG